MGKRQAKTLWKSFKGHSEVQAKTAGKGFMKDHEVGAARTSMFGKDSNEWVRIYINNARSELCR